MAKPVSESGDQSHHDGECEWRVKEQRLHHDTFTIHSLHNHDVVICPAQIWTWTKLQRSRSHVNTSLMVQVLFLITARIIKLPNPSSVNSSMGILFV